MRVTRKELSDTQVELIIIADSELLVSIKEQALNKLSKDVKIPGFRGGRSPLNLVEKYLSPARLQTEFLDMAINQLYIDAASEQKLRPTTQPEISITKFVPFDALELTAKVEIIGAITLPDYKNISATKQAVKVLPKDVDDAIHQLQYRDAVKKPSGKAAKKGDEVIIDFNGNDAKSKEPISGTTGKDYPLWLGSGVFIPGFEEHMLGLKAGENKTFDITFPKDYGLKVLQNRKVSFTVTVKKVNEVTLPKLDDKFAAKVGPFKTISELKGDMRKQLQAERQNQAERKYENELVQKLAEVTKVAIPDALIDEQLASLENDERQNLIYRGTTWDEFLKGEGLTEEEYRKRERPNAELRVRASLALAEVAEKENVDVSRDELDKRLFQLKQQYIGSQMEAELDKPESRQNILNNLVTEKTVALLVGYNNK
jgi:trigger factor